MSTRISDVNTFALVQSDTKITGTVVLDENTGNEAALTLNYTTNKSTSGNDTGFVINQTDTWSPGISLGFHCLHGANSVFAVDMGNEIIGIGTATPNSKLNINLATSAISHDHVVIGHRSLVAFDELITIGTGPTEDTPDMIMPNGESGYCLSIQPVLKAEGGNNVIHSGTYIRTRSIADGSARTITKAVGLYIDAPTKDANTTITEADGIYIAVPAVGNTNYGINNQGALNQKGSANFENWLGITSEYGLINIGNNEQRILLDATDLHFLTHTTERMTILHAGNVGIGIATPNANAILDVTSTTMAFMPPRMTTTQRDAIVTPTEGMLIFNLTTHVLNYYGAAAWAAVGA